jgi:hypothetical protein
LRRSQAYAAKDQFEEALADLLKVTRLDLQNSTYFSDRAYLRWVLNNHAEALCPFGKPA